MITIAQAKEALENMDDYARMEVGVDSFGPRAVLENFINQQAKLSRAIRIAHSVINYTILERMILDEAANTLGEFNDLLRKSAD